MALDYPAIGAVVFAVNLLPAFGPPTAAVLVACTLSFDVATVPLVACGALAAAAGRYVLARAARAFRPRLSAGRLASLDAAAGALRANRGGTVAGLGLFALSPVPSAPLFIAAGVLDVALLPLTAAFFAGRLISYTIYVTAAGQVRESLGSSITATLTSPLGIAIQLLSLALLAALLRLDWAGILSRRRGSP